MADVRESADITKGAVVFLMVLALIGVVMGLFVMFSGRIDKASSDTVQFMDSAEASKYTAYDGAVVSGSSVSSFIVSNKDSDIGIIVTTRDSTGTATATTEYLRKLTNIDTSKVGDEGYATADFEHATKKEAYFTNFKYLKQNGAKSYIKPGAKFHSVIIMSQGKVVGVAFDEQRPGADSATADWGPTSSPKPPSTSK